MLENLLKIETYLEKVATAALRMANIICIASTLLIVIQIFLRFFFLYSLPWSEEMARCLVVYFVFLASGYLLRNNGNPNVEIFYESFGRSVKFYINCTFYLLELVFLAVLFLKGIDLVRTSVSDLTPAMQVSWAVPFFSIPLGSALMIVQIPSLFIRNYINFLEKQKS